MTKVALMISALLSIGSLAMASAIASPNPAPVPEPFLGFGIGIDLNLHLSYGAGFVLCGYEQYSAPSCYSQTCGCTSQNPIPTQTTTTTEIKVIAYSVQTRQPVKCKTIAVKCATCPDWTTKNDQSEVSITVSEDKNVQYQGQATLDINVTVDIYLVVVAK